MKERRKGGREERRDGRSTEARKEVMEGGREE